MIQTNCQRLDRLVRLRWELVMAQKGDWDMIYVLRPAMDTVDKAIEKLRKRDRIA